MQNTERFYDYQDAATRMDYQYTYTKCDVCWMYDVCLLNRRDCAVHYAERTDWLAFSDENHIELRERARGSL